MSSDNTPPRDAKPPHVMIWDNNAMVCVNHGIECLAYPEPQRNAVRDAGAPSLADEFAALAKAATPGDWWLDRDDWIVCQEDEKDVQTLLATGLEANDREFVLYCANNRDAILAALRRAEQPDDARVARALAIATVVDEVAAGKRKSGPLPVAQMRTAQVYIDRAEQRLQEEP